MGFGTYHFTQGPKYDVGAYMATLFGGEVRDLVKNRDEQKAGPNSHHKIPSFLQFNFQVVPKKQNQQNTRPTIFLHKIINIQL